MAHEKAIEAALKAFNESYFGPGGFFGTGSDDAIMRGHMRAALAAFLRAAYPAPKTQAEQVRRNVCRVIAEEIDNEAR